MCETRDLGIQWPQWHTFLFNGQGRVDMRLFCPRDVKKMLLKQVRTTYCKKWASRHECGEIELCCGGRGMKHGQTSTVM